MVVDSFMGALGHLLRGDGAGPDVGSTAGSGSRSAQTQELYAARLTVFRAPLAYSVYR